MPTATGTSSIPIPSARCWGRSTTTTWREGTHLRLYDKLGAHPFHHEGVDGVHFAVWAPNAQRVSVVGDFNDWDGRRHVMRKRMGTGVWEIFLPGLAEGANYKFEIIGADGKLLPLKSDPYGFAAELRPKTASRVARIDHFAVDGRRLSWPARAATRCAPCAHVDLRGASGLLAPQKDGDVS